VRGIPVRELAAERADALHAAMMSSGAESVLVCGPEPATMATFRRAGSDLGPRNDVAGAQGLVRAARRVADLLGVEGPDPFAALDRLSLSGSPDYEDAFAGVVETRDEPAIHSDVDTLSNTIRKVAGPFADSLGDAQSLNAKLQNTRRDIAASFVTRLARIVNTVAEEAASQSVVAAGGALFGNPRFNTELAKLAPNRFSIPAVPEAIGRAIGAVASVGAVVPSADLALGPSYSEEDIKRTLDNCRLDYVYEPEWSRLISRVSRMLAQGKIVGWFQGAMAFGPRSLGSRSILADPSNRYARQNVNEYLRQRPTDEPLPVAFAPSMIDRCLAGETLPTGVRDVAIDAAWRQALAGALNGQHAARVHGAGATLEPQLKALLEYHANKTGTPGLIEVNLSGPGEPLACSPRDAVRTVYSSAIDALLIGRFLLMKDYWLLRTEDR
jgi:carbamoyltransferase